MTAPVAPPAPLGPFSAKSLRQLDVISYDGKLEVKNSLLKAVLCRARAAQASIAATSFSAIHLRREPGARLAEAVRHLWWR